MNDVNQDTTGSENSAATTEATATGEQTSQSSSTTQTKDDGATAATILAGGTGDDAKPDADGKTAEDENKGDDAKDDKSGKDEDAETNAFLGAPDGDYELSGLADGVKIDADALAAVAPVAKELNLSNEGLSKIAGVYAEKVLPHVLGQFQAQMETDIADTSRQWATEARTQIEGGKDAEGKTIEPDPVFQGKTFQEVTETAHKAVRRFGGDGLADYLEKTKLGNNPEMVRAFFLAGSAISEDTSFDRGGGGGAPVKKTLGAVLYEN